MFFSKVGELLVSGHVLVVGCSTYCSTSHHSQDEVKLLGCFLEQIEQAVEDTKCQLKTRKADLLKNYIGYFCDIFYLSLHVSYMIKGNWEERISDGVVELFCYAEVPSSISEPLVVSCEGLKGAKRLPASCLQGNLQIGAAYSTPSTIVPPCNSA